MATKNPAPTNAAAEAAESMVKPDNDNELKGDVEYYYGNSDQVSGNTVAHEFFFVLLQSAPIAHMLHLQTRSFAEHMALDTFYKEMPGLVDDLVENYQGKYGLVTQYPSAVKLPTHNNGRALLENLSAYIQLTRGQVAPDSEIQNLIDEIQSLVNSTLYKSKFLY